jgi:hypothetical protein
MANFDNLRRIKRSGLNLAKLQKRMTSKIWRRKESVDAEAD